MIRSLLAHLGYLLLVQHSMLDGMRRLPSSSCFGLLLAPPTRRHRPPASHHHHHQWRRTRRSFDLVGRRGRGRGRGERGFRGSSAILRRTADDDDDDDLADDVEGLLRVLGSREDGGDVIPGGGAASGWSTLRLDDLPAVVRETGRPSSPVEEKFVGGRRVFVKRDDLLRLPGSRISGNKARKLLAMNEVPADEFPNCLVSYGGPQSNSMLALAALVNYKNRQAWAEKNGDDDDDREENKGGDIGGGGAPVMKRFVYYTKKLPRFLRNQPSGNLFRAKSLGMEIVELSRGEYSDLFGGDYGGSPTPPTGLAPPLEGDSLWVPQGGAFGMASVGARVLAREIVDYWSASEFADRPLTVCVPSGTCTMAVLLHHSLKEELLATIDDDGRDGRDRLDVRVVAVPCVGSAGYAKRQMMALCAEIGAPVEDVPTILRPAPVGRAGTAEERSPPATKYFPFGRPDEAILETFETMKDGHDVLLDLVYGAPAWTVMLRHFDAELSPDLRFDPNSPLAGREIMYVHSGGQEGINSQLLRYKYEGLLSIEDVQLPGRNRK